MATAFFRTVILYLLLIAGLRLSGKRQIGELEPIELVLTMLLSDLASVPMQDFDSPLINGVVPILTLLALTTLLSYISFRSGRFRSLICGEPAIVVRYGKLQQRAMRHNRMTVDELLEEIYHGEPKETYELDTDGLSEAITAAVDTIADGWDVKPRNGGISEFDSESGSFKFAEGTVGIVIDREKMAADMLENAMTIPYTKPRRLMNQFPMKEADGSTKMHDPAAPTKNPETCHCQISWKRLIDATAPDRTTMATDMTIRVSYFESSLPARGVTSVVPMK